MQLKEIGFSGRRPIDGYGPGFFRIGGTVVVGGVLLSPGAEIAWGGYGDAAALLALAPEIDVLLIGTGAEIAHIPAALKADLEAAGIGVEIMATPPACRTFNVLLAEGRRVAAALIPV
jgi:uncharacterized protein